MNKIKGIRIARYMRADRANRSETAERNKERQNIKNINGPRKIFLSYILDEKMEVGDAVARFIAEYSIYSEEDVIKWLREELKKNTFDEETLILIEKYIKTKEKNIKENILDER